MNKDFLLTEEQYVEKILKGVSELGKAFENLNEIFDIPYRDKNNRDYECNDYIVKNYPFEDSFDEVLHKVWHWEYTLEKIYKNVKNGKSYKNTFDGFEKEMKL